jgi:Leucine-rich repeat (LRR) protein
MRKLLLIFAGLAVSSLFAQDVDYNNDIVDVQTIFDRCGLTGVAVQSRTTMENGRVAALDLKNRDISKDGISFLPPEIGKLTALKVLNCSGNILDSIPSEIGALTNLQKLDLSSNRIVIVTPAIGRLANLTHLDLRHNRIVTLPSEIDQCKKLVLLQLWGNKLETLDDAVTRLPALEELYLKDNRLTTLPANLVKMKLNYIDVIGNKLCNLDAPLDEWFKKKDKRYRETQKCW